ncbi:MAG TPA: hemerythrin domain-containing protein [Polyangiaceae bacterium]|jgi:hemerythrin superfamily protein
MKATTLLERQHRDLEQLCDAVERGSVSMRQSLLPQLAGDLVAHLAVEEEVFYPAASAALHEETWLPAARKRHLQTKAALDLVLDMPTDGEEFARAMGELRRSFEVQAQEEASLFPRFERAVDADGMRELLPAMLSVYHAKVEAGYAREPRPRAMRGDAIRP